MNSHLRTSLSKCCILSTRYVILHLPSLFDDLLFLRSLLQAHLSVVLGEVPVEALVYGVKVGGARVRVVEQ